MKRSLTAALAAALTLAAALCPPRPARAQVLTSGVAATQQAPAYAAFSETSTGTSIAANAAPVFPASGGRQPGGGAMRFNVAVGCTQAATVLVQASNDNFSATAVTVASFAVAAGSANAAGTAVGGTASVPIVAGAYRIQVIMGTTAGACNAYTSTTAS